MITARAPMKVKIIPVLSDTFVSVLELDRDAIVIDPGSSQEVEDYLDQNKLNLKGIYCTHHHADHIQGVDALKKKYECPVWARKKDSTRIPQADNFFEVDEIIQVLGIEVKVLEVSAHTRGHVAFYFPSEEAVFCGDSLFSLGCGRLFEGDSVDLFNSLKTLRALPDSTKVYFGHEYTQSNLKFARWLEPNNPIVANFEKTRQAKLGSGEHSSPSTIGFEKILNPFFKWDNAEYLKKVGIDRDIEAYDVLGFLRERKDEF